MAKIIVPVGYPLGAEHPDEDPNGEVEYNILIGRDKSTFPNAGQYGLWRLMFTDAKAHRDLRFTYEHFVKIAESYGFEDPSEEIDNLLTAGMAIQYDTGTKSSMDFLKRYRLLPQGEGLGNTPDDSITYRIGTGDQVFISLFHELYVLWSDSSSWPSMWERHKNYAKRRPRDVPVSGDELALLFAATVPAILAAGAGFLLEAT